MKNKYLYFVVRVQSPKQQRACNVDEIQQQTVVTSTSSSASVTLSQPPLTSLQPALICSSTMSTFHFCPVFEQRRPILSRPMRKKRKKKKITANHSRSSCPVDGGLIVIVQAVMSKPLTSSHEGAEVTMAERFGGVRLPAGALR